MSLISHNPILTVVSHNAYWFQGEPYDGEEPDGVLQPILDGLADLYAALAPDVLCVQEVHSPEVMEILGRRLALSGTYCQGGQQRKYGGAMLYRDGRVAVQCDRLEPPPHRMWQVAGIRANGRSFRVCNVHLPSKKQLGEEVAACARAADLESMLGAVGEVDVIAGDFNEGPDGAATALLAEAGYMDAAVLTGCVVDSTGIGKGRSDQIWVHESLVHRVTDFTVLGWDRIAAPCPGKDYLSDHLPLRLVVQCS